MASVESSTLEAEIDIIEQQQHFHEVFGHESSILYDCYTSKESLVQKMDLILPQKNEIERNELITTIWNQNVYNGGNCLFMSPIYITLVLDHKPQDASKILSKSFELHPVFRVQKCTTKLPGGGDGDNCCAVFIDESRRVYMNWNAFRTDNAYADGLVVAPMNGIYNASSEKKVKLEFFEREAGITKSPDRSLLRITADFTVDIAAGIADLTVFGIRGICNLFDGKKQPIKFTHPEARSSWINLAAEAFSASAADVTELLAKTDDNSPDTINIIPSTDVPLNAGVFGLHSTGCLKDIYRMISRMYKSENLSTMEITHLSTLMYLLTHSVKNQRAVEEILSLSQARDLIDLKKILRDSQKMAINGLVHETTTIQGLDRQKIGQITVRSLKNQIDPQPNLMKMNGEEHEEPEKENVRKETLRSKYLEMFLSRIASIGSHVCATLSDDEKIAIAMGYEVESVISKFQALQIVYMQEDLRETVKDVLLSMPLAASHIFFDIVAKFTTKNAEPIQSRLGRFIPIDIFMTDIYSLLIKVSASHGQELEQYLLDYNESAFEDIEKQICRFYDSQIVVGDSNKCSHCAGFHYNDGTLEVEKVIEK